MSLRSKKNEIENEESFFVSMTDIMVGMLFIFLIIIVYFSMQIKDKYQQTQSYADTTQTHQSILLDALKKKLRRQGVKVDIDKKQGILRLPDGVLFETAKKDIVKGTKSYTAALKVSEAFYDVLECSVLIKNEKYNYQRKKSNCEVPNRLGAFIESVLIEGHTDNKPFIRGGVDRNLDLSAQRATSTYELMTTHRKLKSFNSPDKKEIFGVSAFGPTRPIVLNNSESNMSKNRRIDIRILMYAPASIKTLNEFKERLCNEFDYPKYCPKLN